MVAIREQACQEPLNSSPSSDAAPPEPNPQPGRKSRGTSGEGAGETVWSQGPTGQKDTPSEERLDLVLSDGWVLP